MRAAFQYNLKRCPHANYRYLLCILNLKMAFRSCDIV